jgi:acyl-coenzyme A synthetase/AMP-(fatty) acid ligase
VTMRIDVFTHFVPPTLLHDLETVSGTPQTTSPAYMSPGRVVYLAELPKTPLGKVERRKARRPR